MTDRPEEFEGTVTIEWRAALPGASAMPGWTFTIRDMTGEMIPTVTEMTIHVPADGGVWAELTVFCDADGRPILVGTQQQVASRLVINESSSTISSATFPVLVAGMSVA